jgi:hypothetical protein
MLFANESGSPLNKALHTPWCRFIFGLRQISLAEYLLVLRMLFPLLLQIVKCTTAIASTICIRWWATTRTKGNGRSVFLIWCFCWKWLLFGTIYEPKVCVWFMKLFASATLLWTWVVITLCSKLWCNQLSLRTLCNMWRWLLNLYDLGLYVGWFEIIYGFTDY